MLPFLPTINHLNADSYPQHSVTKVLSQTISTIHAYESTKCILYNESTKCTTSYIPGHYGYTYYSNTKSVMKNRHTTNNKRWRHKCLSHRIFLTAAPQRMGVGPLSSSQPGESIGPYHKVSHRKLVHPSGCAPPFKKDHLPITCSDTEEENTLILMERIPIV